MLKMVKMNKQIKEKFELINNSIGASILISLGCYVFLKIGNPIGSFLFSFGLISVCYMKQNLFTGKCGFIIEDKIKLSDLAIILVTNLIAGYLCGLIYSFSDIELFNNAVSRVSMWDISVPFFIKSVLCGLVMYTSIYLYRKGTVLGILLGIPLFIFCGFHHCIANIVTMGIARTFDLSIFICVLGNFIGSIVLWYFTRNSVE